MRLVTEDFIEVLLVMIEICFEVMSDIIEVLGIYLGIFVFDDGI
jgi:hypothetical protein